MTKPRAHHYLPIFYLKGFTETNPDGWLWVYEKDKPMRKSKPVNEAHQRDFYSYADGQGNTGNLEQQLSGIESAVAPLFRAIEGGYHRLVPDEWEGLTIFVALMWLRGPMGKAFVNDLAAKAMKSTVTQIAEDKPLFKSQYEEYVRVSGNHDSPSADEMLAFILEAEWDVEQKSNGYALCKMFEGVLSLSPILLQKRWEILYSDGDNFFCTSDVPVVTILPEKGFPEIGAGFGAPGVQVFFPVSKRKCLVLRDHANCDGRLVRGKMVREINKFMMVGARRFLYTCEKNTAVETLFNKIGCGIVPGHNAFMPSGKPRK